MKKIYCYISSVLCGITLLTCSACSATPTVAKGSNDVPEQSPVVPIDAEKGTTDPAENIQMLIPTTLIISKKPGNTGISRDIRTEFTTDLLLSD